MYELYYHIHVNYAQNLRAKKFLSHSQQNEIALNLGLYIEVPKKLIENFGDSKYALKM